MVSILTIRAELINLGKNVQQNYLNDLGTKLTDKTLGKKSNWKIVNNFKNKCKIPRIPPLLVGDKCIAKKRQLFLTTNSSYSVNLFKIVVHCLSSHTLQTLP